MNLSETDLLEYMAAVAQRQRFERMVSDNSAKFSGYGKELFESSFAAKINALTNVIERYELTSGQPTVTAYDFWTNNIKTEMVTLSEGSAMVIPFVPSGWSTVSEIQTLPADRGVFQPIPAPSWNCETSLQRTDFSVLKPTGV